MTDYTIRNTDAVKTTGQLTIVSKDLAALAQNAFAASQAVTFNSLTGGVKIRTVLAIQTYVGSAGGAALSGDMNIWFLNADPAVAHADTALTAAEWITVRGMIKFPTTNWSAGDGLGQASYLETEVYLPPNQGDAYNRYWLVVQWLDATSLNSAAGDDEALYLEFMYE